MVEPSLLNNRPLKRVAAVVVGIFVVTTSLAGCRINFKDNHVPEFGGVVVRVVDGDTFIAEVDGKEKTVDLLNVLAPVGGDDAECLGDQATENLKTMLPEGKKVRLEYDDDMPPKRRNNKAAAFSAGNFVNADVAKAGFAVAEKQSPNNPYYDRVLEAQDAAQENGKGLFDGSNKCTIAATVEPAMERMKSVSKAPPSSVESAEDMIDDLKSVVKDGQSAKDSLTGMKVTEGTAQAVVYASEKARWEKEISGTVSAAKKRLGEVEGVHTKLVAKKKAEEKKKKEEAKLAAEREAAERAAAERAAEARAAQERAEAAQKARADA
ncbi:thermonuclease family protein, partial [Arthrobacter rhombi]